MIDENGFLMIEPKKKSKIAIIDDITKKVTVILRHAEEVAHYKGRHTCVCGAKSGSTGLKVKICGKMLTTNSLIVHYVVCHRSEIPSSQMKLILRAGYGSRETPTEEEIQFL